MNLELNDHFINKLDNAVKYWKDNYYDPTIEAGNPKRYFDYWCRETYGLSVVLARNTTNYGHEWLTWHAAEVINGEKYTWFLLSF